MNNTVNTVHTVVPAIVGRHLAPCFLALALLVFSPVVAQAAAVSKPQNAHARLCLITASVNCVEP